MFCKNCGKELCQGDTFCKECGVAQNNEKPESAGKMTSDKKKKKKGKKIIIAIIALLIIFIFAIALSDDDIASDTDKEQISGNYEVPDEEKYDDSMTFDEKISVAAKNYDFETINTLITQVTEENKESFVTTVNDAAMKYLCNNRYNILIHNYNFIEDTYELMTFAENAMFSDTDIAKMYLLIKDVYADKETAKNYENATDLVYGAVLVEGNVISRIQNSDYIEIGEYGLNEEYIDEYRVRVEWMDNDYIIIRSETPISKGSYYNYCRYVEDNEYITDDGFEHTWPVYVPMTESEVAAYREAENNFDELSEKFNASLNRFDALENAVMTHSDTYTDKLTTDNLAGIYAGGMSDSGFRFDNYHKLTLNDDMTFVIKINALYDFVKYEGTYTVDGNKIICKYYDSVFTFEISDKQLVHLSSEGPMEGCIAYGEVFIK